MADIRAFSTSTDETNDEMKDMYLDFTVGHEVYGIEIRYVIQIIGMQEITEMPDMPSFMKGFINLRGSVIPVVSVRLRFGKAEEEYTDRTCIVVVRVGQKEIGLIVDAIQETITIEPEDISPPPSPSDSTVNPYISGVAKLPGNRNSILVDVFKLFGEEQFG